jgi:hypothetical protein
LFWNLEKRSTRLTFTLLMPYDKIEPLSFRRDGRVVEGACLENRFGESQRGFESLSLRLSWFGGGG